LASSMLVPVFAATSLAAKRPPFAKASTTF
jgi:hypothetical protein